MKPIQRYIVRRLVYSAITIFAINFIVFSISRLAGDPVAAYVNPESPPEIIAAIRKLHHLDEPIPVQFIYWIQDIIRGDLGRAASYGDVKLSEIIYRYLPLSFELNLYGLLTTLPVSYWIGTKAATKRDSAFDHFARLVGIFGHCVPAFFTGLLILAFLYPRGWATVDPRFTFGRITGMPTVDALLYGDIGGFIEATKYMIGPLLTSFITGFASNTRILRSSILEELSKDYISTGRSKGLSKDYVEKNYARRNALIPFVTMLGLSIATMFSGNAILEVVFNRAGLGSVSANAAKISDHNTVQAFTMIYSVMLVLANLGVDIVYGYLDPRIRYGERNE